MSESPSDSARRAVFLSYASQDVESAIRIRDALAAEGVEVWFDQNELVGGDAWDQKIRGQIKACALFVSIISPNTQSRREGYFRLEWKLAAQRTHTIADGTPFLLPIALDHIRDAEALVPEEFRAVQWTRLPAGELPPTFVARVKEMLGDPAAHSVPLGTVPLARHQVPPKKTGATRWSMGTLGAAALALLAYLTLRPGATHGPAAIPPAAPPAAAISAPAPVAEKSIAVLPFEDMSADKDQAYMSDGLAEELLNLLAKIPALRVTSRSSAFSFKGKPTAVPEIARRLNVAHVLEGSVRKSGNKIRVTAQLIDARTDTHVWSETYDRDLTDIFAVQDEIAGAVVTQLKLTLLGPPVAAQKADPRAYELYLQANEVARQSKADRYDKSIALLREAVAIDPRYAAGWTRLAGTYLNESQNGAGGTRTTGDDFRLAQEAADRGLAIDPNDVWAHVVLFGLAQNRDNDLAGAARHLEHAFKLEPTNSALLQPGAALLQNLGRLDESLTLRKSAIARDPLNPFAQFNLGMCFIYAGRPDDAITAFRASLAISPGRIVAHFAVGLALLAKHEPDAALGEIQQETSELWKMNGLPLVYHALGRATESDAALAAFIAKFEQNSAYNIAGIHVVRGEKNLAFEWLEKAVATHDTGLSVVAIDPQFADVHSDPRWLPFLRKIGKAPEQLAAIKFEVKPTGK